MRVVDTGKRDSGMKNDLDGFIDRVVRKIHERYDAMIEVVRRRGQDAQDQERRKEPRE